jgi:hypothetical protein
MLLIQINKGTCDDVLHIKMVMLGSKLGHEY